MPRHLISSTAKIQGLGGAIPKQLIPNVIPEAIYSKGMYPDIDAATIPSGGLKQAQNSVVRFGKTTRRPGTALFTPTAPDVNRILLLNDYVRGNGITNIVRHTKNSVNYCTTSSWTLCAPTTALTGTDFDHFCSVVIDDRYFFTNNGKNKIQELALATNTYANLGNAVEYKKITGFFNRIVAANLQGATPNPISLAWSGDLNFAEWDSTVDPSAGSLDLVDSSTDITDFITDIFGFDAVLVILRQKSIWLATKQPSASDPFNVFCKVPGLGCTCTYGAAKYTDGIVFPDLRTKSVYTFSIDGKVTDIGEPIRKSLFALISDPEAVIGSYDPVEAEYSICVSNEQTTITTEYVYNFRMQAWTVNYRDSVSAVSNVDNIAGSRTIDELQGTIDGLLGTINGLATPISQLPRRLYGRFDGEIVVVTEGSIVDYIGFSSALLAEYSSNWQSRSYENLGLNSYLVSAEFKFRARTEGIIVIDIYRDASIIVKSVVMHVDSTMLNKVIVFKYKKQTKCDRFFWVIRSVQDIDLISDAISTCSIPT